MSSDYDVIVAGGGPAGLSVARTASANGVDVLLLELQAQIGQTQTSAWIPSEFFKEELAETAETAVEGVNLHSVHRDLKIEGDFGKIVDRKVLDKLLAFEAVRAGADIWVGSPVMGLLRENRGVRGVRSAAGEWSEEIESEVVVDATGARAEWSSLFLKEVLNSSWDREKTTQTNEYLMTNVHGGDVVDLYFNSILAPMGYAWIHPLGEKFAMAGIRGVRIHPDSALDEFIGREAPSRLQGSVPIGAYRGQLPVEGPLKTATSDGILAVGSSAGQIYPLSGHGTKYALEAGRIAGRVVAEGIREGDTSKERLSEYGHLWRNRFESEIQVGGTMRSAMRTSQDQKMDALLDALNGELELQESFIDIFLGENLGESLETFFKNEECRRIFGRKRADRLVSLYT